MESPLRSEGQRTGSSLDEIERVKQNAIAQLLQRGLDVPDDVSPEQLVDLVIAVEEFEAATAALGSDGFTNTLDSSQPDNEDCVLPRPRDDESIEAFTQRVRRHTEQIRRRGKNQTERRP